MITKVKTGPRRQRSKYDSLDLDYIGDNVMVSNRQRKTLIDLYSQNLQEEDLETRLSEIDNLTSTEAEEIIYSFLSATWS